MFAIKRHTAVVLTVCFIVLIIYYFLPIKIFKLSNPAYSTHSQNAQIGHHCYSNTPVPTKKLYP